MEGEEVTIGFNCRMLVEAIRAIPEDTETLRLRLNSNEMAIVIEPAGGTGFTNASPAADVFGERALDVPAAAETEGSEFMYFVMPMHMNN